MENKLYEIIIVGAGPAGISLAAEAVNAGIDEREIIIYEKAETHSWAIRKFYPENKLVTANYKGNDSACKGIMCLMDSSKKETLSYLDKVIVDNRLVVKYNHQVYEIKKLLNGFFEVMAGDEKVQTKTIAIAIGILGKPNKPDYSISGDVRPLVNFDVTSKNFENKKILVVGGGDSASEYCQYLIPYGNKIVLCYRKKEFSRMNQINHDSVKAMEKRDGLELYTSTNIESIEKGESGVIVNFQERENEEFDEIIYALGGTSPTNFLESINIKMSKEGPEVSDFFESSEEGIFLIGDISAGRRGGSINLAFNSSHDAMKKFCRSYLECREDYN